MKVAMKIALVPDLARVRESLRYQVWQIIQLRQRVDAIDADPECTDDEARDQVEAFLSECGEDTLAALASWIKTVLEPEVEATRAEIARLAEHKATQEARIAWARESAGKLLDILGIERFEGHGHDVSRRAGSWSTRQTDNDVTVDDLPEAYVTRPKPKFNLSAIGRALSKDKPVLGFERMQGPATVVIK